MKSVLTALALFIGITSIGQSYQTIRSDQINYFGQANQYNILATKTDSVALMGADSILYAFKTLRHNDTMTNWMCQLVVGPSWYGDSVVIKNNGENWFFNRQKDTIVINTQAVLNDTFLLCHFNSGEYVKGWISEHDTMTVFGQLDSVKTIQLFSDHSNFMLEDSVFRISKDHGFITFFPFYSFPYGPYENYLGAGGWTGLSTQDTYMDETMSLMGTEFPRQGISRRTIGEIYSYQSGDTLRKTSGSFYTWPLPNGGPTTSTFIEEHIVNRVDFGLDSVQFEFDKKWSNASNPGVLQGHTFSNMVTYTDLGSLWTDKVPEEFYSDTLHSYWTMPSNGYHYNYLMINYCGEITEGYHTIDITHVDSNGVCFSNNNMGTSYYSYQYVEGLGGPYHGISLYQGTSQVSMYYRVSCGATWFAGVPTEESPGISIFPNPANDQFTINLVNVDQTGQLSILDLSGKIVFEDLIVGEQSMIDVSTLPSGIYVVNLKLGDNTYTKKLIKN